VRATNFPDFSTICQWCIEEGFMARTNSRFSFTIHRSGWLVIAVFFAFGFRDLGFANGMLGGALIVVSLLVHELGHAIAAVLLDVQVHRIGLKFIGAYTHRKYATRPIHDVIITASGPLASVFMTVASLFVPRVGVWLATWNFGIVVVNLIPFPGTDGYRILKTLFWPDAAIYRAKVPDVA
jgi:Zn-dependent protease